MHHLRNALAVLVLGVSLVISTPAATSAAELPQPDNSLARVNVGPISVDWAPTVDYERLVLTIAGPGDLYIRQELKTGQNPSLSLFDKNGQRLPDGMYTYELRFVQGTGRPSGQPLVLSGYLSVQDGSFVTPGKSEAPPHSDTKVKQITAEQTVGDPNLVVPGDLYVKSGACIGYRCDETFDEGVLHIKGFHDQVWFDDPPDGQTATHSWVLYANDFIGGGEYFALYDVDTTLRPFTVEGDAPANALYVRTNGNLGLGTATPAQDIHAMSGNTPTIRLEQDTSDGLSTQTWDIGANNTSFFVRDVTNSSALPFQIRAGAPTSSIDVAANGRVGIGTSAPTEKLHVFENGNANTLITVENPNTGATAAGVLRAKSDIATVNFQAHGSGRTISRFGQTLGGWSEFLQVSGNGLIIGTLLDKPLILGTNSTNRLQITPTGDVGIGTSAPSSKLHVNGGDIRVSGGSFIDDGVTLNAPDYVFEPDYSLMPIEKLRDFVTREKRLPNVPSAREIKGQGLNLSQFQMRLLEKVEELTLYTLTQDERIKAQQEQIAGLLERLSALEKNRPASAPQVP